MKEPGSRYIAHRVEGTLAVMSPVTLYCPFRPLVLVSPPLSLRRSCRNVYGQTPSRQRDVHKFSLFATCWCLHGFSFLLTILTPTLMPAICHGFIEFLSHRKVKPKQIASEVFINLLVLTPGRFLPYWTYWTPCACTIKQ